MPGQRSNTLIEHRRSIGTVTVHSVSPFLSRHFHLKNFVIGLSFMSYPFLNTWGIQTSFLHPIYFQGWRKVLKLGGVMHLLAIKRGKMKIQVNFPIQTQGVHVHLWHPMFRRPYIFSFTENKKIKLCIHSLRVLQRNMQVYTLVVI